MPDLIGPCSTIPGADVAGSNGTLHIGSYDDEGPVLARLHGEVGPDKRVAFNGPHHEIHVGGPRRTKPSRLKTILRQPVKSIGELAPK